MRIPTIDTSTFAGPDRSAATRALRAAIAIFAVGFVLRSSLILYLESYRAPEDTEIVDIARSLASSGAFADAYGPGTGPTAHTSPLYPILLSWIYRVAGTEAAGELTKELVSSALSSATCAVIPFVSLTAGLPLWVGVSAGAAAALAPVTFWIQTKGGHESALAGLLLALGMLSALRIWRDRDISLRRATSFGLIWAIATLTLATALTTFVALLAAISWRCRKAGIRKLLQFVAVAGLVLLLVLSPWVLRNQRVLGSPILTRSNLGLELQISNNDSSSARYRDHIESGLLFELHPRFSEGERARALELGEVEYHDRKLAEARKWISTHPGRFVELTSQRFALFWLPEMARQTQEVLLRLISLLGILGLAVWAANTRSPMVQPFAVLLVTFPLTYYLVQSFSRYRYPIDWCLYFLAFAGLYTLLGTRRRA